nr:integrase, catalytic region, zinc finger, CCHC-type, peptidase aspartic, catalytic [Tanacetum cinerariifolium]
MKLHTQEETVTLREIVESERLLNPLNTSLDYACKYIKRIQELLIIILQTCPCITDLGTKLMVVTPKNNDKKIRLTEHIPSSGNTPVKTTSSTNVVSNTPVLSSTRVNLLSSASGSQPQGNIKNDRIQRTPRRTFTLVRNVCPLTRFTTTAIVPLREPIPIESNIDKPVVTLVYSRKSKAAKKKVPVVQIVLWYLDSGCSKHMTGDRSQLMNFVQKFLGTVKFGNDHVAKIMGYGDYKIGNATILRVYFVEGLGHNLFSVGLFCDSDLEVAFCQHTCFIRNLDGVDLLTGSRGNNLYTLSLQDIMASSPICLLSKALKTKSKDETPDFIIKFMKMIQVRLKVPVRCIRTDNGTEFVNQTLRESYEEVDISYETSIARSPQQNGVVERRNRTLIEAAHTMLIYAQALLFLWAEAVATACYTQNRSIIRLQHGKTPYELLHNKLPDLLFLYVFGAL